MKVLSSFCVLCCLLLTSCQLPIKDPQLKDNSKLGQSSPLIEANRKTDVAVEQVTATSNNVQEKETELKSKLRANIDAAHTAVTELPESAPQVIAEGELSVALSRVSDVASDPVELAATAARGALARAGQVEEARKAFKDAAVSAAKLLNDLVAARQERDKAKQGLTAALAEAQVKTTEFLATMAKNKAANEAAIAKLRASFEAEIEKERKAFMKTVGRVLMGIGALLILVGVFVAYSGMQTGDPFKAIIKALVFAGGGAFCFACAWAINHPWFKYFFFGGGALAILAVAVYLWAEWNEAKDKRKAKERMQEADEAEDTLKKVTTVIDTLPKSDPIFSKLSSSMNDNNKALIMEMKAEEKRTAI